MIGAIAMKEWWGRGIEQAVSSTLGWAAVIVGTLALGFCAGYWIGHREIMAPGRTLTAFLWLPFLWLLFPQVFLGYGVTVVAWYLPMRYESGRLRIVAASANLLVWLVIIDWIVEQTADAKFFRF